MYEHTKVVCIDDSATVRAIVTALLARAGMQVVGCASGAEALAAMRSDPPDVVLLDLHMPEMDGVETLRRIVADPALCQVPVIMMTATADNATTSTLHTLGARDVIVKPLDQATLASRVARTASQ